MQPSARHRKVEAGFRELLDDAGLDCPDRVEHLPGSVVFYWDGPRLAVFVDFDGEDPASDGELADLLMRGMPGEHWPAAG
jgi:hypothetical protein